MLIADFLNNSIAGQIATIVGIGAVLDMLIPLPARLKISAYLSGSNEIARKEFEFVTITSLISIFVRKSDPSRIAFSHVFLYTITISSITTAVLFYAFGSNQAPASLYNFARFALIMSIISYPFDFYSIYITKKIFYYEVHEPRALPKLIWHDLDRSIGPVGILGFLVFSALALLIYFQNPIMDGEKNPYFQMTMTTVLSSFIANVAGSVLVTLIQIVVSIMGSAIRGAALIVRNLESTEYGQANLKTPFTVCFLVLAIITVVVELAIRFGATLLSQL